MKSPVPFITSSKKGVHYCQVIAPEYLREVITGGIAAPECEAPPEYFPPAGPPSPPPLWNCDNPQGLAHYQELPLLVAYTGIVAVFLNLRAGNFQVQILYRLSQVVR